MKYNFAKKFNVTEKEMADYLNKKYWTATEMTISLVRCHQIWDALAEKLADKLNTTFSMIVALGAEMGTSDLDAIESFFNKNNYDKRLMQHCRSATVIYLCAPQLQAYS